MIIKMHPSVQKVAEFMQQNIPADELVEVANAIYFLAQPLWSKPLHGSVYPLMLVDEPAIKDVFESKNVPGD
jgi:hypothetical protein